jgi:phosphotransferase system HPr (HPr) family protein
MTSGARGNGKGPRDGVPPAACSPANPVPPAAAPNGPFRRTVRVINPLGLHYRAADRFARAARQFACGVSVYNGDVRADGKSLMDLILLVALPGSDLILEVDGPDAGRAADELSAILGAPGGEDYEI